MKHHLPGVLSDVRGLWRRDRALLWPLSALFLFLPQFAVALLVPPIPEVDPAAGIDAWGKALEPWVASYGGWYVLATLLAQYGALAIVSLYMPPVPAVGGAMGRAARLFPRALLAGLLVTVPCGVIVLVSLPVPVLPLLALPAMVYVLARSLLANPVILAERGTGAVAAIVRSWRLTSGHGLTLAGLVGAISFGGQVLSAIVVSAERAMRGGAFDTPVVIAAVDAVAAGIAWAAALMLALVQVSVYRRLAR